MKVNVYKEDTMEFSHTIELQRHPLRPDEYLEPPPNTTPVSVPTLKEHQAAVFNESTQQWRVVTDHRGKEYYLPDGTHHKIEDLDVTPPDDALDEPPPPTEQQQYAQLLAERDYKIMQTDWLTIRHRDELELSRTPTLTAEQYHALQEWRQTLRDLPATCPDCACWEWPAEPAVLTTARQRP